MRGRLFVAGQAVLVLALGMAPWWASEWAVPRLLLVAGALALVAGVVVGVVALRELGPALTPMPEPREGAQLMTSGLYRRVRHPIYFALLLAAAGWTVLLPSWWTATLWVALALLLNLKSRYEESWLRDRYVDYAAYAARTPRFVPRPRRS